MIYPNITQTRVPVKSFLENFRRLFFSSFRAINTPAGGFLEKNAAGDCQTPFLRALCRFESRYGWQEFYAH